jgi:hypothetical protein
MEEATGSVPEELQLGEDKAPWSISFDWNRPVTVQFDDHTVMFAIRGRRFTSGDRQPLSRPMEIAARYQMQMTPEGVRLERQGDIDVTYPGREGERQSAVEIFYKTLMRNKFAGLFKPEIIGEGIQLPGRWQRLGKVRLRRLSTGGGWLAAGWR